MEGLSMLKTTLSTWWLHLASLPVGQIHYSLSWLVVTPFPIIGGLDSPCEYEFLLFQEYVSFILILIIG
jgi:hypothetical protein